MRKSQMVSYNKLPHILINICLYTLLSITAFSNSFAQESTEKKAEKEIGNSQIVSPNSKEAITDLLLGNSPSSLMFDEEQNSDIDRAVDSFLNNQSYVPDENELQAIQDEKALEEARIKAEEEQARNEKSYLYLSSILYLSPKSWIVWIGDQKITSETNSKTRELYIQEIYKDKAKILWKLSISKWKIITGKRSDEDLPPTNENNQVETVFELRPNQTFMLNENRIVEGKAYTKPSSRSANNGVEKDGAESNLARKALQKSN